MWWPELFREEVGVSVGVRALRAPLDLTVPTRPPPGPLPTPAHRLWTSFQLRLEVLLWALQAEKNQSCQFKREISAPRFMQTQGKQL